MSMKAVSDNWADAFTTLSTATISDALDSLGRPGSLPGLAPLANGQHLIGRAFTVRYVAAGYPPGTVGDYIDDVAPGQVVVLDNNGRIDCTVWGDILTTIAHQKAIAGTVIDGVCRDVQRALSLHYPIYSRGRFMRTGKDRVQVSDVGGPVSVSGIQINVGDLLIGDDDGVIAIPHTIEQEVLEKALLIAEREAAILADALGGMALGEARGRHGYHQLQRRRQKDQ